MEKLSGVSRGGDASSFFHKERRISLDCWRFDACARRMCRIPHECRALPPELARD
jgi:hypothetical protein